jgi:hypothetical protein
LIKIKIEKGIENFEKIGINGNWTVNKSNIYNYLIEPGFEEYIDTNNIKIMLWTVFESDDFGLAMISIEDEKIFFGINGSFEEQLHSM